MEVIPSILVKTQEEFQERLKLIEPHFEVAHLDIADGIFVPNKTIDGWRELDETETNVVFRAHLMVSKPENHVARWLETNVESIIFHCEATTKAQEVIDAVKETDKLVGVHLIPKLKT